MFIPGQAIAKDLPVIVWIHGGAYVKYAAMMESFELTMPIFYITVLLGEKGQ